MLGYPYQQLGKSVENEDHVQIGNIIQDCIISNFAALEAEIGKTLGIEGIRNNLNLINFIIDKGLIASGKVLFLFLSGNCNLAYSG